MTSGWVKKPRWKVSHYLRADNQRPKHLDNQVGMALCGSFITIDEHLGYEPTGIDTVDRCQRCETKAPTMTDAGIGEPMTAYNDPRAAARITEVLTSGPLADELASRAASPGETRTSKQVADLIGDPYSGEDTHDGPR